MKNRFATTIVPIVLATTFAACYDSPVGPPGDEQAPAILDALGTGSTGGSGSSSGSGNSGGTSAKGSETRAETFLVAAGSLFPKAKGRAKFRSRGGERELQIEVENLSPGVQVTFLLDGVALQCAGNVTCTAAADGYGEARIELNTDGGSGVAGRTVPMSVSGRTVAASVGAEIVAQGTFN